MITIKNKQRTVSVDLSQLKTDTQKILDILNYSDFDLGILLTTNTTIQKYNRLYRNKNKPTDILSFPYHPHLKAGKRIRVQSAEDKNVGDLIISLAYVKKDAPKWQQTFEQRMRILLVHGICHLLGYDHIKDKDYRIMHKKEREILKKIQ